MTNSRQNFEITDDQLALEFIEDIFLDSISYEDHQKILELINTQNVAELKIFLKKFDFNIFDSIAKDNLINPIFYAIDNEKLQSIKALIEFFGVDEFLKQKFGSKKLNPIFYTLNKNKSNVMAVLLPYIDQQTLLNMSDISGKKLLYRAFAISRQHIFFEDQSNIKLILKKICGDDGMLDIKLSQLALFYEVYSFLRLGYTKNSYPEFSSLFYQSKKNLEELLTSKESKIFKEVYQKVIDHLDTTLPIKTYTQDQENLYIYSSELLYHESYFVFHVNQENNQIVAVSYIDGNTISPARIIQDLELCFAITKFNLPRAVNFESQDQLNQITGNFLVNYTKKILPKAFYKNFKTGNIEFCGQKFSDCIQEQSLPIRPQKRGNCVLKSSKALQRFLVSKLDPQISFEFPIPQGKQDGRKLFKAYKKELKDVAVDLLEDLSKTLRKDDIFENFLLDEKARLMQQIEEKTSLKQVQSLKRKERMQSKIKSFTPLSPQASLSCVIS